MSILVNPLSALGNGGMARSGGPAVRSSTSCSPTRRSFPLTFPKCPTPPTSLFESSCRVDKEPAMVASSSTTWSPPVLYRWSISCTSQFFKKVFKASSRKWRKKKKTTGFLVSLLEQQSCWRSCSGKTLPKSSPSSRKKLRSWLGACVTFSPPRPPSRWSRLSWPLLWTCVPGGSLWKRSSQLSRSVRNSPLFDKIFQVWRGIVPFCVFNENFFWVHLVSSKLGRARDGFGGRFRDRWPVPDFGEDGQGICAQNCHWPDTGGCRHCKIWTNTSSELLSFFFLFFIHRFKSL